MKMRKLLRNPIKKILCGILFLVISTAVLLFSLQYWIDGISLAKAEAFYSYTGTIYNPKDKDPDFVPISADALAILQNSKYLSDFDLRHTYSCKIPEIARTPDWFLAFTPPDLSYWYIVEGIAKEQGDMQRMNGCQRENFDLQVDRYWCGAQEKFDNLSIMWDREASIIKPMIKKGDRCLIVGSYTCPWGAGNPACIQSFYSAFSLMYPEQPWGDDSPLVCGGVTILPEELEGEEKDAYIRNLLDEKNLTGLIESINGVKDVYTLYTVSNMSLLFPVREEDMYFPYGRELTSEDTGRKVCVISQQLAAKNDLKLGDHLNLSSSRHHYVTGKSFRCTGRESGLPFDYSTILDDYTDCGEFEIVGTYAFLYRDIVDSIYSFSYNDIFIPEGVLPWEAADGSSTAGEGPGTEDSEAIARPYRLSFQVQGPLYEDFLDESESALADLGYRLKMLPSRWEEVKGSFYDMQQRHGQMLLGAATAFLAGAAAFVSLLLSLNRKEYALRRLLGAYPKEARGSFLNAYALCAVPAAALSVLACGLAYQYWMVPRMAGAMLADAAMPGLLQCMGLLVCLAGAELAAAFALLYLCARRLDSRPLLNLLK